MVVRLSIVSNIDVAVCHPDFWAFSYSLHGVQLFLPGVRPSPVRHEKGNPEPGGKRRAGPAGDCFVSI